MTEPTAPPTADRVVVGIDGTTESKRALRWAAAEARLRGATLAVVHVWGYPNVTLGADAAGLHDRSVFDDMRREAQELVSRELFELRDEATGVEIEETVVEGAPADRLLEVAADADLLVLGSRGNGGVGQQCARDAVCPVVIVPSPRSAERRRRQPPPAPWRDTVTR